MFVIYMLGILHLLAVCKYQRISGQRIQGSILTVYEDLNKRPHLLASSQYPEREFLSLAR